MQPTARFLQTNFKVTSGTASDPLDKAEKSEK